MGSNGNARNRGRSRDRLYGFGSTESGSAVRGLDSAFGIDDEARSPADAGSGVPRTRRVVELRGAVDPGIALALDVVAKARIEREWMTA
jgi:hypothetical protein